jgi:predicted CXXCH cytochrome family protein
LLLFTFFLAAPAVAQDIILEPGQSCQSAGCHEDLGQKNVVHMPAGSGTMCGMCHEASAPTEHSFKVKAQGGALCNTCHNVLGDKKNQHMPVKMGMCTMCHDPHQSDNRRLLKARPVSGLCMNCHSPAMFDGEIVHGPVADGDCMGCHEPHASEHGKLAKAALPDLCFTCHNRMLRDSQGQTLPPAQNAFDNEALVKHMPFGAGLCNLCHVPHASDNHRLLNGPYPESFYASYAEEKYFCFGCHDAGAFAEPYTEVATGFRNGRLNLHFRHVNRDKGRGCRACHDHHAAPNAKLIRERVPFGQRFITIESVELTETGGQCGPTCHELARYDRADALENALKVSPRPPDPKDGND